MKKITAVCMLLVLAAAMAGCSGKSEIKNTLHGSRSTFYEMTDGTWLCDNLSYKHCLKVTGKPNNAAGVITYTYVSNLESITFEQALKDSGLSSHSDDYFSPEDAVLVDVLVEAAK